jgi:hypothetical protein
MGNIYTKNRLLQFMYRETGILQSHEIACILHQDAELNRTFAQLKQAKLLLPTVQFAPRTESVNAILRYSAETALEIDFSGNK